MVVIISEVHISESTEDRGAQINIVEGYRGKLSVNIFFQMTAFYVLGILVPVPHSE